VASLHLGEEVSVELLQAPVLGDESVVGVGIDESEEAVVVGDVE
jgi:hypothetical protein